jgi:uncharacterized protein YjbI with pentapeptide repeats
VSSDRSNPMNRLIDLFVVVLLLASACTSGGDRRDGQTSTEPSPVKTPFDDCSREGSHGRDYARSTTLTGETFGAKNYRCGRFRGAELRDVQFNKTALSDADFSDAELVDVRFRDANLGDASFESATLRGVSFVRTNLRAALFAHAELESIQLIDSICPDGTYSDDLEGTCEGHGFPRVRHAD